MSLNDVTDLDVDSSSAFLTVMRRAVSARQNRSPDNEHKWLTMAAQLHPLDDNALDTLTMQWLGANRHENALELAAIIAQLASADARSHFRLGYALQFLGRHAEAVAPYRRALSIDPHLPRLRSNLAGALMLTGGDSREQVELLEGAVADNPEDANGWTNLAHASRAALNLPRALQAGALAVRLAPTSALAHNNYALALREAQRWDDAAQAGAHARTLAPADATMRSNLAMLHLMRGNYEAGWPLHEARWDGTTELGGKRPAFASPCWQGEPLHGKTLLVWGEQGMGDVIQFCRYIPMLAEHVHAQGGHLVWNSFPQMSALLMRSLGRHVDDMSFAGSPEALPHFDYELPLMSAPFVFGTRETTIPCVSPYLHADAAVSEQWHARLAGETRLKVGLAWTGSHGHQRNPFRRVGWERYAASFAGMENVAFFSLQPGADADVAAARAAGLDIADHTAGFTTFDDTAAFVSALDLVISVCTSVAHLSGALGQRTWVLLDVNPHWVWLLDRTDSPWYPGATLYRQLRFGEWRPVLDAVTHDLNALAALHAEPVR